MPRSEPGSAGAPWPALGAAGLCASHVPGGCRCCGRGGGRSGEVGTRETSLVWGKAQSAPPASGQGQSLA